jgi:DNA-directed RNA polymerase specialized sigma subunit
MRLRANDTKSRLDRKRTSKRIDAMRCLSPQLGRTPTADAILIESGLTRDQYRQSLQTIGSIDAPL